MRQTFSFSLGQNAMVVQAEVYAIKAHIDENIKRGYCNGNIYIHSVELQLKHLTIVKYTLN
jgi:hypothetical protein